MIHLEPEQIERLLHGEADAQAREHARHCEACRVRVLEASQDEAEIFGLLTSLDRPAAVTHLGTIIERARPASRVSIKWAAGIVLALGAAGAALALPGSPLRDLLRTDRTPPPQAETAATDAATGIALAPGSELVIQFRTAQQRGFARVRLVEEGEVIVRSLDGSATFTSSEARLLIENDQAGDYDIAIPRSAQRLEILLGSRRLFSKLGAQIASETGSNNSGEYLLDLTAGRR